MSETVHDCENAWQSAIEECRRMLDPEDFKLVTEFESPEKMIEEVRELEQRYARSVTVRLLKGIKPHLSRLQMFSTAILLGIGSGNIKVACFWGATTLLIELASQSEQALSEVSTFLNDLGNKLVLFDIYKDNMQLSHEILENFFSLMVDLVLNCVSAIKHFRKNDIMTAVKVMAWKGIEAKFQKTIKELDSKIEHLRKLAKAQSLVELNRTQAGLAQQLAELTAREELAHQKEQLPCILLPFPRNKSFFGRTEVLEKMEQCLALSENTPSIRSVALWGTGGIGKTQIALEFAVQQVQKGLQVVIWISSETEGEIFNSFIKAANALQPPGYLDAKTPDQKRFIVLSWLQKTTVPWLVIFDNFEDSDHLIQNWPVTGNGSIVVTCRSEYKSRSPAADSIEVPKFSVDESVALMLQQLGKTDSTEEETAAARELAVCVGGLAIAVDILSKQIYMHKRTITQFRTMYDEYRNRLLRRPTRGAKDPYYDKDVSSIWSTAFASMSENSARLLSLLCYTAPDEIPEQMLNPADANGLPWPFLQNVIDFEDAKMELVDLSLIRINSDSGFISVHRLTQDEYIDHMSPEESIEAFQVICRLICHAFPRRGTASAHHLYHLWQSCEQLIHHVIALQQGYQGVRKMGAVIEDQELTQLMADAAWYLAETGSFETCHRMVSLAAESCSDKFCLIYAGLCYSAGSLDHRRGRYMAALAHYQEALDIREQLSEPDSNELATTYSAVGMALTGLYRGADALEYYKKAFAIFDNKSDKDKAKMYNIDRYLRNRSRAKIALEWYDQARDDLAAAEHWQTIIWGKNSHYHGESQFELGKIAEKEGNLDTAMMHFECAYSCLSPGKPTHQSVMAVLYHQGLVSLAKQTKADDEKAWEYLDRCLAICQLNEPKRGDQGESARVKWQIAKVLDRREQHAEADAYRASALETKSNLQRKGHFQDDENENRSWDSFLALLYR